MKFLLFTAFIAACVKAETEAEVEPLEDFPNPALGGPVGPCYPSICGWQAVNGVSTYLFLPPI
jgi:hypothetical protein